MTLGSQQGYQDLAGKGRRATARPPLGSVAQCGTSPATRNGAREAEATPAAVRRIRFGAMETGAATTNVELIRRFFTSFQARDPAGMAACYTDDVAFTDPAFGTLFGDEARAMWQMLCERGKDLTIEFRDVAAGEQDGSAHWEARYTFSGTGRPVHNVIDARFWFRDGLISRHDDRFNFHRWSRQALGTMGLLLGWTPIVRRGVRRKARAQLDAFRRSR